MSSKLFKNADTNYNNLLEYSEMLKKIHSAALKLQKSNTEGNNIPKLVLNKSFS